MSALGDARSAVLATVIVVNQVAAVPRLAAALGGLAAPQHRAV